MSERRDLWVPVLVLLAALGVAAWDASAQRLALGALALVLGLAGAGGCLALTLRRAGTRAAALAGATLLFLASLAPGLFRPLDALPWALLCLAIAFHARALPSGTRTALLGLAGLLALLGLLTAVGVLPLPRPLASLGLAGALACAVQVLATRPRPEAPVVAGPEIGVFGGSFDPFHRGHRAVCEASLKRVQRLLVVVAGTPPHKAGRETTPFHHRVAMARLGVEGMSRTEVLEIEGKRDGPSYTVDTLDALRRLYPPGTRFRLILGADSFQELPLWKDWEGILDRADLLVAARPGSDLQPPPEFQNRNAPFEVLEAPSLPVSSSDLRRRIAAGRPTGDDLSPGIAAYVRDHGLYREGAPPGAGESVSTPPVPGESPGT